MKHSYLRRLCLLALTLVLVPQPSRAYVLIDSIYYDLYPSTHTATVTHQLTKRTWYNEREIYYSGSVVIPASITYNGETYTVNKIDDYTFAECKELTSITIPHSITYIGSFNNCTKLTAVYISDLASWCAVSYYNSWGFIPKTPLYYAHHLYLNGQKIERLDVPNGVTKIGNYAFSWCTDLTSVNIPNSVTDIGGSAFSGCPKLTSVTINSNGIVSTTYSLSTTLSSIFGSQVEEYVFGDEVKSIGEYACYGCERLTSVTIGNSVTSIGNYAFKDCSNLASIIIPNSVTNIGESAFQGCSGLKEFFCYAVAPPDIYSHTFWRIAQIAG